MRSIDWMGVVAIATLGFACIGETTDTSKTSNDLASGTGVEGGTPCSKPPPPPKEAIDACASLSEGDTCHFTIDGHAIDGSCRKGPGGEGPLACAPKGPPPPPPPPKESVDACASLSDGDACHFTIDGHALDGTCRKGPGGAGKLACIPKDPPPPPKVAIDVCSGQSEDAKCSFDLDGHTLDGRCHGGPDGGPLACAPPPPPCG
jgi:hypothetical protein